MTMPSTLTTFLIYAWGLHPFILRNLRFFSHLYDMHMLVKTAGIRVIANRPH